MQISKVEFQLYGTDNDSAWNGIHIDSGSKQPLTTVNGIEFGTVTDINNQRFVIGDVGGQKCNMLVTAVTIYYTDLSTGSTLSEGNVTILVGVACAAVFGLGGFLLGRKKVKS